MKNYKTPLRRTRAARTRKVLAQMQEANAKEWAAVTMRSAEKDVRARLQAAYPDLNAEEIERRVAFVMKGGSKPTTAKLLSPGKIPADVLAKRKAERQRKVKANRHRRRIAALVNGGAKQGRPSCGGRK